MWSRLCQSDTHARGLNSEINFVERGMTWNGYLNSIAWEAAWFWSSSHNSGPLTQFSSVAPSCSTLCNPMNCSTPGLPVHHQLPDFTQTHVHWVDDAIQPSHPLSSPSPPAPNPSQHQGLFQWVNSSHEVAKGVSASASVLPMNTQDWSPLGWTGWISLQISLVVIKYYFLLHSPIQDITLI